MDVIEKARELAQAISDDPRCKRLLVAKEKNDNDKELQDIVGEFNLKKIQLNNEFNKPEEQQSKENMTKLENDLKEIYQKAMSNAAMAEYNDAKKELDELVNQINAIIQVAITGEVAEGGCSGNCASCGGCH
jgi:cell fate (sporulation/competence/biofilm development) regulator YlbF (YheA/YmcA/DUF963 family)